MFRKFIVWTGKEGLQGLIRPSTSIASCNTLEEAGELGREWQERVHRNYPGRKAGHCVITTYGEQRIVGSVPEMTAS